MTPKKKSLIKIVNKLQNNNVDVDIVKSNIRINIDLTKINFSKISPLLYLILNKFENFYFIHIKGVPYCLMSDAAEHIIYNKTNGTYYQKDRHCQICKYCHVCPGWTRDHKLNMRPGPVNNLPREVIFEVTRQCNLNCSLCFSTKSSKELPLAKIKVLIDECDRLGIKNVRFSGGEPLLYKNIEDTLCYAKSKKLYVIVNTNATVINKKLKRVLKNCTDNLLISLQGFNPTSEKRLTKSTLDFKEKMRNIAELNSQAADVRLGTIISQTLINNFSKYSYLVKTLGIKRWDLYRPMFDSISDEFNITPKNFLKLMKYIKLERLLGKDVFIANPLPFCITKDICLSQQVLYGAELDDGHSRLVVDTEGFLKPSYFIPENLGPTIKDAWKKTFIKKLRLLDYLPRGCQECCSLKWCKGGSRHWAKVINGSYFESDPLMNHTQKNNSCQR